MNDSKIINFINTNSFKLVHRSASTDSDLYKATLRLGYSVSLAPYVQELKIVTI